MANLKKRVQALSEEEEARHKAAWEPLYEVAARDLRREDINAVGQYRNLALEEKAKAANQLPPWGSEAEHAAWMEWIEAVNDVYEHTRKPWPDELPEPPEEPEGLWETFRERAAQHSLSEEPPVNWAACVSLFYLSVARALRRLVY